MRSLNRIHSPVHQVRIFQSEIFWPTLDSIYDGRLELRGLDDEETHILKTLIDQRNLVDINEILKRQRELAVLRAEKQDEIERKWNLIHAGCQFIAMLLNESCGEHEEHLTPHEVYRTLVAGDAMQGPVFTTHIS